MVSWFGKSILFVIGATSASNLIYLLIKKLSRKPAKRKDIYDVLFFSYPPLPCNYHPKNDASCQLLKCGNLKTLIDYLNSAKYDLDVCVYMLTSYELSKAIYLSYTRGLKVRVIADADMAYAHGSQIRILQEKGVPVRVKKSDFLMHHKFAVIDARKNKEPLVITGSLNWTVQGITKNWDNVLITSQPILVKKYNEEFNRLWKDFAPQSN